MSESANTSGSADPSGSADTSGSAGRAADFAAGLRTLNRIGMAAGVDTLVLHAPATLTWLTGGRVNVPNTLDAACLDIVVEGIGSTPSATVVTTVIEAPRLATTEFAGLPLEYTTVPWTSDRGSRLPTGSRVGSDRPGADRLDLSAPVAAARRQLTGRQADRLRAVGRDAAAAITAVADRIDPSLTEYEAAALIAAALLEREMDPICLFVAGETRMGEHRHPLPTGRPLGKRASLVCCARRHGLIASVTRIVCFGPPPRPERYRALLDTERAFLDATTVGATLGGVVRAGIAAYDANGFAADEWRRHHQGGLSGWQSREFPAGPDSDLVLAENFVVAWNPSGDTFKIEDTCLVTVDGVQPLVHDPDWPTVTVGGRARPDLLVR